MPSDFTEEFSSLAAALAGQFRVEREIGRGGMGVVYLARDLKLDRLVALKVLPSLLATQPVTRERFLREARTAARLAHPNVVPIYRADEAGDTAFFAMAFVDGESLADRLRTRGPFAPAEAVRILRDVAWALAYAHASGVVHRDVKPENILIERQGGRVLVTDFGIAHHTTSSDARLTQDGAMLGTLHYMSPEQVQGLPLDGRSDLYALGVVGFQLLSGRLPFDTLDGPAVLLAHATRPAPRLTELAPSVPAALANVIDRTLAKDPDARYATGEELADALARALAQAPASQRQASDPLPPGLPALVSEVQAAEVWRRAAQLQADALRRIDAQRELASRAAAEQDVALSVPTASYKLQDVVVAAAEAGISRQFVAMALAELPREHVALRDAAGIGISEEVATRYLGTSERSIAVSVPIAASPAKALRALGAILAQPPYSLVFRDSVGGHPLDGGVAVFDLPGVIAGASEAMAGQVNWYWMNLHQSLEARQVQVTLRAEGAGGARSLLTMTADLRPGVRRNVLASRWLSGSIGAISGALGATMLAKAAGIAIVATLGAGGGLAIGVTVLGLASYRLLYRSVVRKARGEMQRALEAVAGAVQAEVVFGEPLSSRRLPPPVVSSLFDSDT
ncbi:MAG: serine/threonine-protein kinase [Gemmatimonadaceae bacterium]|nr:serine/threonine-protein kinase [Gemmatimonadaceae bacterium]